MEGQDPKKRTTIKRRKKDYIELLQQKYPTKELQVPTQQDGADTGLLASFASVLEEVEEEDFPDYEVRGSTAVRSDGAQASQEQLVRDYQRLKTEIRRLEDLSSQLYQDVYRSETQYRVSILSERKTRKRQAITLSIILLFLGMFASVVIYLVKEQREVQAMQMAEAKEREKEELRKQLATESQRMQEKIQLLEQNYDLEKKVLASQLDSEKQQALEKLRQQVQGRELSGGDKELLLKDLETQLAEKYRQQYDKMLADMNQKLQAEKRERQQDLQKMSTLAKKLDQQGTQDNGASQREIEMLKRFQQQNRDLQEQLAQTEKRLSQMQQQLSQQARQRSTDIVPTVDTRENIGTRRNTSETSIDLGSTQYDARKMIEVYYTQKMVDSEQVDVVFSTGTSQIMATFSASNDTQRNLSKERWFVNQPRSLRGTAHLALLDWRNNNVTSWRYDIKEQRLVRATSGQRRDSVLDTEFSYEDWWPENIANYKYQYVKTEMLRNKREAHIILATPATEEERRSSQYSKKYYWIDVDAYFPLMVKFFGQDDQLSKIYGVKSLQKIKGVWRPDEAFMINYRTRNKTYIRYENWRIGENLPESLFSPQTFRK